jgi:hypothetical protein
MEPDALLVRCSAEARDKEQLLSTAVSSEPNMLFAADRLATTGEAYLISEEARGK